MSNPLSMNYYFKTIISIKDIYEMNRVTKVKPKQELAST